ncbi:MAG TPA: phytanoyl-CoA dioxygenase family protein [Puia sp.]|nr:phytanoyl-CoA dioxygenase family protein [Puia sp.]
MKLTIAQIDQYHENGFLFLENLLSSGEIDCIRKEAEEMAKVDGPQRILEKNGAVRSIFAPESSSELFARIISLDRLVRPAMQLIGYDVYVHQSKINIKQALVGDCWEWHQDFTFWHKEDGMEKPDVVTAMIFLNDVTEFNAPMFLIPGSHKIGIVGDEGDRPNEISFDSEWFRKYYESTSYMSALTTNLKFTIDPELVSYWAKKRGIYSAKGPAGSVLFFHGNVFHASAGNISPWDRNTYLVTYNSLSNTIPSMPNPRPGFIANRNFTKITPSPQMIL